MVDAGLLDEIDLTGLDATLSQLEIEQEAQWRRLRQDRRASGSLECSVLTFAFRDAMGNRIAPRASGGSLSTELSLPAMDGARLRGAVVRQRRLV